jgi:hypothetical protein
VRRRRYVSCSGRVEGVMEEGARVVVEGWDERDGGTGDLDGGRVRDMSTSISAPEVVEGIYANNSFFTGPSVR